MLSVDRVFGNFARQAPELQDKIEKFHKQIALHGAIAALRQFSGLQRLSELVEKP